MLIYSRLPQGFLQGIKILWTRSKVVSFSEKCVNVNINTWSARASTEHVCAFHSQCKTRDQYISRPIFHKPIIFLQPSKSPVAVFHWHSHPNRSQLRSGEGRTPDGKRKVDARIIYAVYLSGVIGSTLFFFILKREFDKARNRLKGIEEVYDDLYGRRNKFVKYKDVLLPGFVENTLKDVENFEVREDDIWVVSYPRSGTTWTQEIIFLIHSELDFEAARKKTIEERFPYLEYVYPGIKVLNSLPSPRLIKSHLPHRLLPEDIKIKKPKIIYVIRNPKDVVVSCFYFVKMLRPVSRFNGTFEQFFEKFIHDKASYSPWWRHVKEFWDEKSEGNILFVMYEDLIRDPEGTIQTIASFLEKPLSSSQVKQIAEHCSFDSMRKNDSVNYSWWDDLGIRDKKEAQFLRKGQVGDWRQHLTPEMSQKIDRMCSWKLNNTGLNFDYGTPNDDQNSVIVE